MKIPGAQVKNDDRRRKGRSLYFLELHQENDRLNNKRGFFGFFIVVSQNYSQTQWRSRILLHLSSTHDDGTAITAISARDHKHS
jgi:hypothetical protein